MPRQNRVTPRGELIAVDAHGTFMGNRGCLHDAAGRIRRAWQLKRWIICELQFKGRHRPVMQPGCYTELFFLDEATALAAGHRPCAECRRGAYEAFRAAFAGEGLAPPRAPEMDALLHAERIAADGGKRTYRAALASLPDGAMVDLDGAPHLLWRAQLWPWRFEGYGPPRARRQGEVVVLTPRSTVRALRRGYVPQVGLND